MNRRSQKNRILILLCAVAVNVSSCQTQAPPPSRPVAAVAQPTQLAKLEAFTPTVNYKRGKELVWLGAQPDLPLYRYDAVQTHASASAKIAFANGSNLELGEKTLVIINPSATDKAVLREGNLKGSTKRELWLVTSAALLRMKATKNEQEARATFAIKEGDSLKITLQKGSASVVKKTPQGGLQSLTLQARRPVTISAPTEQADFGMTENSWIEKAQELLLDASAPEPSAPQAPATETAPITIDITYPQNYAVVSAKELTLRGKTTSARARVLINGAPAKIDTDLTFSSTVPLNPGTNPVQVQLIRPDGSSEFKMLTIMRHE